MGQIRGMWVKSRLGRWMTDSKQGMPLKLGAQQGQENMRCMSVCVCVCACGESQRVLALILSGGRSDEYYWYFVILYIFWYLVKLVFCDIM